MKKLEKNVYLIINAIVLAFGFLLGMCSYNDDIPDSISWVFYIGGIIISIYGFLTILRIYQPKNQITFSTNNEKKKYDLKYFTKNFNSPEKDCIKSFELLRRVYNLIEMSHLNDGKLNATYCKQVDFPRSLGEHIFNLLSAKDQIFRETTIKRQKRYRNRIKRFSIRCKKYCINYTSEYNAICTCNNENNWENFKPNSDFLNIR